MSATTPLSDIRAGFFAECEELLERLTDVLAAPEFAAGDPAAVNAAFRAVHTVKGGAASLGYGALAEFAHGFETVLADVRTGTTSASTLLNQLTAQADQLASLMQQARGTQDASAGPQAGWQVRFRPHRTLFASGNEPRHILTALIELGGQVRQCEHDTLPALEALDIEEGYLSWTITLAATVQESAIRSCFDFVEDLCTLDLTPPWLDATPTATDQQRIQPADSQTVRVNLDRVDRLMNLAGELVIRQSMLTRAITELTPDRLSPARIALDLLSTLTGDLQQAVMDVRSQPVKPLFQRMGRILRETAAVLGKDATLTLVGETAEVDRAVIDRLVEPLTHMIRNALDHGIEAPDVRRRLGKPASGHITLRASHRAGRVLIEIEDDGRGIDREKLRAKAVAAGLIRPEETLGEVQIDELIFHPGLSTSSEVGSVSGRGVGMDAVRASVAEMGGRIVIRSNPGQGTCFAISLPLTLAVMEGMIVTAAGQTLILPLAATRATAWLDSETMSAFAAGERMIRLGDRHASLFDLADLLGLPGCRSASEALAVAIADESDRPLALLVDGVIGVEQVVVKPIARDCGMIPGVAGATILGDGRVSLILEPADLIANALRVKSVARPLPEPVG